MFDIDQLTIRQETSKDHDEVLEVVKSAFGELAMSDKTEHLLVERIRKSPEYVPELSLVAILDQSIIGHVILSKVKIIGEQGPHPSLALAPISVMPKAQGKGVGGHLIEAAHTTARHLGYRSIIVLGHARYFPKFGYQRASSFGISLPFDAPDENCFAIELQKGSLESVSGRVIYSKAFSFLPGQ